jgi:hypothetical protein
VSNPDYSVDELYFALNEQTKRSDQRENKLYAEIDRLRNLVLHAIDVLDHEMPRNQIRELREYLIRNRQPTVKTNASPLS